MKKPTVPTRTCSACGEEKPLAAFLQLSGSQGTVYGSICSICRSEKAKNKATPTDEERGKNTGLRIDSNAKNQFDLEQKRFEKKKQEAAFEENKNRDDLIFDKTEKIDKKEKAEKHHRQHFLESKNRTGFLPTVEKKIAQKKTLERDFNVLNEQRLETHKKEESQKLEDAIKLDTLHNTTDYSSGISIDPGIGGIRFQVGGTHERLEAILGKAGFLNRLKQHSVKQEKPPPAPATEKDPIVEYIKENIKPPSSRRR